MNYWSVKVKISFQDEKTGKVKNKTEIYLVNAVSATESEAKIYKEFEGYREDWEVTSTTQTKIVKVVE